MYTVQVSPTRVVEHTQAYAAEAGGSGESSRRIWYSTIACTDLSASLQPPSSPSERCEIRADGWKGRASSRMHLEMGM